MRQSTTDKVAQNAEAQGNAPLDERLQVVDRVERAEEPENSMRRDQREHQRDHAQHHMLKATHPVTLVQFHQPFPSNYAATRLHTSVTKPPLALMRLTCNVTGVILAGSCACRAIAACCNASVGCPCFLSSLRSSRPGRPSLTWHSYFSSLSPSSTRMRTE